MPKRNLTRRRMIAIMATAAGSALVAGGRIARADDAVRWRGSALGAQVSLEIYHPDRAEAERLVQACLAEVRRLEQQFSLYQPDSAICTLNRTGILVAPAPDMVSLLKTSLYFSELTGGAFDPTVQPLWALYARHFSSDRPDPDGPPADLLADALARVGSKGLLVSDTRVALVKHGAAVTLNGIAQGYATDRVVDMLRKAGLSTSLVDMGEVRAIGARPDGAAWHVGLADPDRPGALAGTVDLDRSRGCDHGRRRVPFRRFGPLHASVRSRNGAQPVGIPHGQRRGTDRDGSGRLIDGFQPDVVAANPRRRIRAPRGAGPRADVGRKAFRVRFLTSPPRPFSLAADYIMVRVKSGSGRACRFLFCQ